MSTKKVKLLSPFRYPGGKSQLAPRILDEIKPLLRGNLVYVEPFVGGGQMLCAMVNRQMPKRIIVNDKDKAVASFWECIADKDLTERLVEEIRKTVGMSNEELLKEYYRNKPLLNSDDFVTGGYAAILLNRTSYGGMLERGGPQGGKEQKNAAINMLSQYKPNESISRILALHEAIGSVLEVHNEDFSTIIEKYDHPGTLIYCDPPYVDVGDVYRPDNNMENDEDHIRLSETLRGVNKAWVVVSYGDHPWVSDLLYAWADIKKLPVDYSIAGRSGKRENHFELLIVNSPLSKRKSSPPYWELVKKLYFRTEAVIKHHEQMFREVGQALKVIRDNRLYKTPDNMTRTFAEYCTEERGGGRDYVYKLIRAAEVSVNVDTLSTTNEKPINESQVRPLTLEALSPEQQSKAWDMAVRMKPKDAKRVSSVLVKKAVEKVLNRPLTSDEKMFVSTGYSLGGVGVKFTGKADNSPISIQNAFLWTADDMLELIDRLEDDAVNESAGLKSITGMDYEDRTSLYASVRKIVEELQIKIEQTGFELRDR